MGLTVLYVILPVVIIAVLIRKNRVSTWGKCKSVTPLNGKVFLITGSNSGIGKETARALAKRNATVIMACRDMNRAKMAINDIKKSTTSGSLIPMHLDLASFESIKTFSNEVMESFPKIDVLVNNAGVSFPLSNIQKTKDGFEMNFGVNHLGHFLLTKLLLDKLKQSAPSRIVIVSSTLHEKGVINLDNLNLDKRNEINKNQGVNFYYCASKLANVYHFRELTKRLKGTGVDVFAVCPGFAYTGLFRNTKITWWQFLCLLPVSLIFLRTAAQAAQTVIYCASEESLQGHSGNFYRNCQIYHSPKKFDPTMQIQLWEKCESLIAKHSK